MNWRRQLSGFERDRRRGKGVTDWNCFLKHCRGDGSAL